VGLVPVAASADRAGLGRGLAERLTVPATKVLVVVLGMVAGADSITDLDLLRHGGMRRLFSGIRAPSTLGTFLRAFTFGHVRQLDAAAARLLPALARWAPLLPGADQIAYLDIDDTVRETRQTGHIFEQSEPAPWRGTPRRCPRSRPDADHRAARRPDVGELSRGPRSFERRATTTRAVA